MSNTIKNSRFPFAVIGLFLVMSILIYIADILKSNAIANHPKYLDGVVMCEYPNHWKGMDFLCYQYVTDDKLYIGRVGAWGVVEHAFDGQKCRIAFDTVNPKNSKVIGLLPQSGEVVSPSFFKGEVIMIDGECSCD